VTLYLYLIDVGKSFYIQSNSTTKDDHSGIKLPAGYDSVQLALSNPDIDDGLQDDGPSYTKHYLVYNCTQLVPTHRVTFRLGPKPTLQSNSLI
jgi:hypothetical protein